MFAQLEESLIALTHVIPLEGFVFIASFVEEIVAPIPSPTVMLVAGSFAQAQGYTLYALIILVVVGALGKTVGALIVYMISSKAEDIVLHKFGKFFGVTEADIARLHSVLQNNARDYALLTTLRALPIMPSVLLSVGSGILKVPLNLFIFSTFFGTLFRDGVYLYVGYVGTELLMTFVETGTDIESYIEYVVALVLMVSVTYFLYKRRKPRTPSLD
jgi:membrane protein DedA with SNARE-associated domain